MTKTIEKKIKKYQKNVRSLPLKKAEKLNEIGKKSLTIEVTGKMRINKAGKRMESSSH